MANDSIKFENGQMVRYDANAGSTKNPSLPSAPNAPKIPSYNGLSNEDYINNMTGKINSLYDAQQSAQLQALRNAREAATAQYQRSIDTSDRQYAPLRDQAEQYGQKSLLANRELMAQQGLFNSGDNVTAQARINNQTASNINQLNAQKSQYVNDIQFQINQLKANGVKEDANLIQQLEAQKAQALLNLNYAADDRSFKLYDINNQATQQNYQNQMTNYNALLNSANMQHGWNQDDIQNQQWEKNYNLQDRNSQWENSRWAQDFTERNKQWQQEFDRQGAWHDQAQALAAARAASGGSGRGGGRSSSRGSSSGGDYSNTDYKNSNQQTLHDYTNNNNYSLSQKLQALSGYANSSGVDSKDAQYANEQKQALLDGRWYEGRYK